MNAAKTHEIRGSRAVSGGLFTGLGVGFFFLSHSAMIFLGCMLTGLGSGLILAAMIPEGWKNRRDD